jgi:hypothetical protein
MKEVFCVAAFAAKLLGLIVFVSALRPHSIVAVQASMAPAYCKAEPSRVQGCVVNALRVASRAAVRSCSGRHTTTDC